MTPISSYRQLDVWKRSMDLAERCYVVTRSFPREEIYGLTSQVRRAAASVPANIAEGHGRATRADYRRFVAMARGSIYELETHLLLAERLDYLTAELANELQGEVSIVGRLLTRLLRSLDASSEAN